MKGKCLGLVVLSLVCAATAYSQASRLLDKTVSPVNATNNVTVNATLDSGFFLSGTVSSEAASVAQDVEAVSTTPPFGSFAGAVDPTTRGYQIVLPAGTYNLFVRFQRTQGLRNTRFTFKGPAGVTVSADITRDITLPMLPLFTVSGNVSNLNAFFPTRSVDFNSNTDPVFSRIRGGDLLDAAGNYTVPLPSGTYTVELVQVLGLTSTAVGLGSVLTSDLVPATATISGPTTGLNFTAPAIPTARLSGTVSITGSTTLPAGSGMFAGDISQPPLPSPNSSGGGLLPPSGAYEFRLATGRIYQNSAFVPAQLLPSPAPPGLFVFSDTPPPTVPLTVDPTVRNLTLPALPGPATPRTISGRVTITGTTTPVANAQVGATFADFNLTTSAVTVFSRDASTDANGDYSLVVPAGTPYTLSFRPNPPLPIILSIGLSSVPAGSDAFPQNLTGANFVKGPPGSVVNFGGFVLTPLGLNRTELTVLIPKEALVTAGTVSVTVTNPAPGGGTSNAVNFTITGTNPAPTITTISPDNLAAGGPPFTLTGNGTNFISGAAPGSQVNFGGVALTTTFVSSTQLTAFVPASSIATAGTFQVTVTNPMPGGGTSNAVNFTVIGTNPVPTITTISPTSATAGGADFTLTVNGTGFVSTSAVNFGGVARTTTFVSATQLTAAIPAPAIATEGTAAVTVTNPTPGGGTSNTVNFTIKRRRRNWATIV